MDNTVLLLPLILFSLVTTTFSLSCTECIGAGDKPCQGHSVPCPPEFDVCVSTLESHDKDAKDVTFKRYCGKSSMCSYTGSLTTNSGVLRTSSTCCYTNNCSPSVPKLPTENTEKNGISCRSCSMDKETKCDPNSKIECIGDEKECVSITMTKAEQDVYSSFISGCGTQGWCKVQDREIRYEGQTTKVTMTCSSGTDALLPGLTLMLLAAFFIMKVIY